MNVLFRVEANSSIGLGHSVRCCGLSNKLLEASHHCILVVIETEDILLSHWYELKEVYDKQLAIIHVEKSREVGSEYDARITLNLIKENNIDWVVFDDYRFDEQYQKYIKDSDALTLYVDDLYGRYPYADLIVNQNCNENNNGKLTEKYLYGTKYFLANKKLVNLIINKTPANTSFFSILISFGASDVGELYIHVIEALKSQGNISDVDIHIALTGNQKETFRKLNDEYSTDQNIIIHFGQPLVEIYPKISVAICAGGVTSLEMISLGIVPAVLVIADNQLSGVSCLDKMKAIKKCETVNSAAEFIFELMHDLSLRTQYSQNGMSMIDGEGTGRVVTNMERLYCRSQGE